jgi:putative ABC transport system permease protein
VDRDFTDAFNLRMVAGRGFSRQYATDSAAFILNEEAVRQMGLQSPVGKRFAAHNVTGTIVGVAKDFHFKSLHEPIAPMVLFVSPDWRGQAYVKIKPGYEAAAVAACEKVWKAFNPSYPFAYRFLDENFDRMYRAEQRTGSCSVTLPALPFSLPAWACSGWPPTRPSNASAKSASARCWGRR